MAIPRFLVTDARERLAVHKRDGSLYRDREGLAWSDPYSHEVRDYNIAVAVEADRFPFGGPR